MVINFEKKELTLKNKEKLFFLMQQEICPHMKHIYPTNDEKFQTRTFLVFQTNLLMNLKLLEKFGENVFQMFNLQIFI